MLLNKAKTPEHLQVPHPANYRAATRLAKILSIPLGGIHVSGQENVPLSNKPYIIAANHRSRVDPFLLGYALQDLNGDNIHFLSARYLWETERNLGSIKLPLGKYVGRFMESCGAIAITQKETPSQEMLEQVEDVINGNGILGIFPEGGVRHGPYVHLERGVGYLAAKHGLDILPVGIAGSEFVPPSGHRDFGNFHVHFGEVQPVELTSNPARTGRVTVIPELRRQIQMAFDHANDLRNS